MAKAKGTKKDKVVNDQFLADDGEKATLLTKEGLEKLKTEYENLKNVKRKEVAARIKEAISFGDLSENSEYEEAKNEQAFVEGRLLEVENKIKHAKIISDTHKTESVQLGSTVHLKNLSKAKEELEIYTIVGSTEADPFEGKISNESPVGVAILDKQKNDKVKVHSPSGSIEYKIAKVV
jgi:transcription elongation factor GreA